MTSEHWERVKELLHQALQLDPARREAFLQGACSSADIRVEVESLLLAEEAVRSNFLQSAPAAAIEEVEAIGILEAGQIFSERFQLVRRLGEGGMGQVWLAEQISPVRRQVALKLIKAGMYDESVVQRFQSERQSLAIMDHPAIAKVFDAGATPQGQPYFVMEYVPGLPITEYCDENKLRIPERLELFIQACEGVQHAHQKAIIHRDLKPANILVAEVDGKPTPRIIDFGLAKASRPPLAGESLFTGPGVFVGTPAYMSPEQADPNLQDIDTRTDVYSLGVVLYVLLAGLQPFESKREKQPVDVLLRRLREEEPPTPSNKVAADRDTSTTTAEARGTEPRQLISTLRGDLDWITMKALEKDRIRRYGSPSELADDVRRYLRHEPVVARPASASYRLRKYVRRHRVPVGVAAGLVLLLAAFSVLQAVQLHRITRERDRANRERDRATRITDFMTGMFKVSDPNEARGNSVTAREILDKASNDMGKGLAKEPEVQSQLMQVMARTYANLGLYARAHEIAKPALDARLSIFGPDDPRTLESISQVGDIFEREGKYADAEKLERQALAGERRNPGPEDATTLETMDRLAVVLIDEGIYDEAEKLDREVIAVRTRKMQAEDIRTLAAMNNLGTALGGEGRYADAEKEDRQLLEVARRVLGPDHPRTLGAMGNLAVAVERQNRFAEAEQLFREVLAAEQRVMGPEHPDTVIAMATLAEDLTAENRLADAEKFYREALRISLKTLGPEHPDTLTYESSYGDMLFREGRLHEAEKLQRETLAAQIRVQGAESPDVLGSECSLAKTLNREGRYAEAEKIAQSAYETAVRDLGAQHPETLMALQQLASAMAYSHRYPDATKLFREAIGKVGDSGIQGNRWSVWYSFACVAAAGDHPDESLQYLREAVNRGYSDADSLVADDDLRAMRHDPHFQEIVASLKHPAAGIQ